MFNYIFEGDLVAENYGLNGEIISIFDHVINIKTDINKGYALTDMKVVKAPYHINLPEYIFKPIHKKIKEKDRILLDNNKIIYKKRDTYLNNKKTFSGNIKKSTNVDKGKLIKMTEKVIRETENLGSLDKSILYYNKIINNLNKEKLTVLQKEFYRRLKDILNNESDIKELLGLGIGLTPTGDDFLVGYLSLVEADIIKDKLNVRNNLNINGIFEQTTTVSALHLKAALKHQFNGKLVDIYKDLEDNPEQYIKNAKNLLKIGSSSGLDTLSGIYFGLIS